MSPTLTAPWSAEGDTVGDLLIDTDGASVTASTVAVDGFEAALTAPWLSVPLAVAVSVTAPASCPNWKSPQLSSISMQSLSCPMP